MAQGFSEAYGDDRKETDFLVVHLKHKEFLLSLVINQSWSLHQHDISNAYPYDDITKIVFMGKYP